jgi:hypothetical protein
LWCLTITCNTILYSKQRANSEVMALNTILLWNHTIYQYTLYSHYNRTLTILDAMLWHP